MKRIARAQNSGAPPTERLAGGNVRGSIIRAHLDWVRDHRDRAEIIEFFEVLPPPMHSVVAASSGIPSTIWSTSTA